ncbi:hexose kinase [Nanchangia anserum]|uniref:Hexose kinase n=1 Tax=Nanchangia anserum TaxID=2692125 RepID=A0A8I0KUH5_9ACTO|nr:hexose kinase [Nanchangia anserum]MBD3689708.1 hexose kinase [Nanchangia anserum]QOX81882.1 hexose kinase [Nanchangia anserum]
MTSCTYDIVTLTPNPSIDRTVTIDASLSPGGVHRIIHELREPGGKGLNVAAVARESGSTVCAIVPLGPDDPLGDLADVPVRAVAIDQQVRTNIAVIDADGETTKINEAGPAFTPEHVDALLEAIREEARHARCVVLAGSLPTGVDDDFYIRAVTAIRHDAPDVLVAVDTSDRPLMRLAESLPDAAPDIVKPNAKELAQMVGADPDAMEAAADAGNFAPVIEAARGLVARGIDTVVATLGGAGAIAVTAEEAWHATAPDVPVRSTVGAGDASLTGYLLSRLRNDDVATCLAHACAYGSAAAALPGTGRPRPTDIRPDESTLTDLTKGSHHE